MPLGMILMPTPASSSSSSSSSILRPMMTICCRARSKSKNRILRPDRGQSPHMPRGLTYQLPPSSFPLIMAALPMKITLPSPQSQSRCVSIVFDKAGHVCHYFPVRGVSSSSAPSENNLLLFRATVIKHRNFVYLQAVSGQCLENLMANEKSPSSTAPINKGATDDEDDDDGSSAIIAQHNVVANGKIGGDEDKDSQIILDGEAVPGGDQQEKEEKSQSIGAILERIDAELGSKQQQQQQQEKHLPLGQNGPERKFPVVPKGRQQQKHEEEGEEDDEKSAQLSSAAIKNSAVALQEREIRRHPRINVVPTRAYDGVAATKPESEDVADGELLLQQQHQLTNVHPAVLKEQQEAGTKNVKIAHEGGDGDEDCDPDSNVVWLAVENARFNGTATTTTTRSAASTASECTQMCAANNVTLSGHRQPCNAFSFVDEHVADEKQCEFLHSGTDFPLHGTLLPFPSADFSHRAFRRFCYPGSLAPFTGCSEFIAFLDYKLAMEPREMFDGLPQGAEGISACIELCVLSAEFRCMSGFFDTAQGVCRLYDAHSLSNPSAFQSHQEADHLYFENGCIDAAKENVAAPTSNNN